MFEAICFSLRPVIYGKAEFERAFFDLAYRSDKVLRSVRRRATEEDVGVRTSGAAGVIGCTTLTKGTGSASESRCGTDVKCLATNSASWSNGPAVPDVSARWLKIE